MNKQQYENNFFKGFYIICTGGAVLLASLGISRLIDSILSNEEVFHHLNQRIFYNYQLENKKLEIKKKKLEIESFNTLDKLLNKEESCKDKNRKTPQSKYDKLFPTSDERKYNLKLEEI
jgi:hypothetical protein